MAALPRSGPLRDVVNGFPIQLAKVQRPALRDETLERPRLLDWLRAKTTGRVVLLLADAGYGKTTLLADFSRRTRMRTLWYRLDHEDRDWTSLLHHLVAAGREHDPGFAPATAGLLAEVGVSGPPRDVVLDTFLRELPSIVEDGGVMLILDDFHLVDDAVDARHIARELVTRAPERTCVVFASRRSPTVPLARLRAVGEVAELGTDDLRFDRHETELLFNQTYGRRLDADVVRELAERTEGWAASLQMVNAALRDRSTADIRAFVRGLTGADQDLYDYLAEEVVGDLPMDLQRFLMETSILQVVTPELAQIATGLGETQVGEFATAAERMTLLTRRTDSPRTHQRYHPLVREFLEARFRAFDGVDAVRSRHVRIADATAGTDWRLGAHHYREAGDLSRMVEVVGTAIPAILGNGQYALAGSFITDIAPDDRPAGLALITSRVDMQQGDYRAAIDASQALLESGLEDPVQRDHALLNLMTILLNYGSGDEADRYAVLLSASTKDPYMALLADAVQLAIQAANHGSLDSLHSRLIELAKVQQYDRLQHLGVTMLNLSLVALLQDNLERSIAYSADALTALESTSGRLELASAHGARASALARLGDLSGVTALADEGFQTGDPETLIEAASLLDSFGDPDPVLEMLERASTNPKRTVTDEREIARVHAAHLIRIGRFDEATERLNAISPATWTNIGHEGWRRVTYALCAVSSSAHDAALLSEQAAAGARGQQAHAVERLARLLEALAGDNPSAWSETVAMVGGSAPWHLTFLAELVIDRLMALDHRALGVAGRAAETHPVRWRHALRRYIDIGGGRSRLEAGRLLETIGEREDVARLRGLARGSRRSSPDADLGRTLARRVAHRVTIQDQGRVVIRAGDRQVAGSGIRRRVLALLCLLLSRPDKALTRDQVLDALWPDLDPAVAVNSLNQTVYFLRRILEEDYVEDQSPGYIHHDSDVLWLDPELVTSDSARSWAFLMSLSQPPTPDEVDQLVDMYRGRFALDFEYEEWADSFRDSLHASYLEVVERSVRSDLASGHYDRGIRVARRALEVDPGAEQIEITLLRLYRLTGAHAAAAEQYSHYAAAMRDDLGVEPPALESL